MLQLVIPSLPGFGFSDGASATGLGITEMSNIFLKLMKRLGYEKFYIQGGDWGSLIASNMATLHKDKLVISHNIMTTSFNLPIT
jgi:pimeloyl-ACP methyl ester carboxylesterase